MARRRQVPWIHQWSRILIGGVAILGMIDTAYLTWVKLSGGGVTCNSADCNQVLTSDYANIFGQPLSGFGLLAYIAITALALVPIAVNPKTDRNLYNKIQNLSWLGILIGGTGMTVFSGYLMFLLFAVIKAACPYCIASAIFSLLIFILAIIGKEWEDLGQTFFTTIVVGMLSLIATFLIFNLSTPRSIADKPTLSPPPGVQPTPPTGWTITHTSTPAEIALAEHLTKNDIKMYGAYWCSHCFEQKQLFGKEAWEKVSYIECANDAPKGNPKLCTEQGIKGFPTWDIKGQKYPGVQIPEKLAELSNYQGDSKFKYSNLFAKP